MGEKKTRQQDLVGAWHTRAARLLRRKASPQHVRADFINQVINGMLTCLRQAFDEPASVQ